MEAAMANDDTPAGFLSRWSRRKADVREGRPLAEPATESSASVSGNSSIRVPNTAAPVAHAAQAATSNPTSLAQAHEPTAGPAPTLADAQQLTPESDFTGFMARGVAPDVKNAAMKKLFTDPHFNVMDRMDIYIDDYSQPDPLPMAMLRQMASAKTLNLFDDEEQPEALDVVTQPAPTVAVNASVPPPAAENLDTPEADAS
jgi:hypothetical protein